MSSIGPFGLAGQWYKGNLHTHSTRSDGRRSPEEVCRTYREGGYDFLVLTDHFLAAFGFPIVDTRAFRTRSFTTLLGAEVHAPATRHGDLWHLLAVGLPLGFVPPVATEDGPALARRCAEAGAFVAVAHPEWSGLEAADALAIDAAHAVEVYNHTSAVRTDRGGGAALLDQLLCRGRTPYAIATDDAHFEAADWFGGWVQVKAPANDEAALLAALKNGAFYASQGPVIRDLAIGGERLVVLAESCQRIIALGAGATQANRSVNGAGEASFDLEPFRKGGFVRVVVMDEAGRRAWANPVRLW